jgi:Holliday junction resolvasome RuvABC endonuclease subunit
VIIGFDASLLNTGWAAIRSYGHGFDVLGYGTIRPKTEATGYMATWERARLLEQGLWDAGIVVRFIRPG